MQKAFIALTLALSVACVVATYTPSPAGYVKAPVAVTLNSSFTNATNFGFAPLFPSVPTLVAENAPVVTNATSAQHQIFTDKFDTKTLSATANNSYSYESTVASFQYNGYAIGFAQGNDASNISQFYLYQTDIQKNTILPRIALSSNTNANFTPSYAGMFPSGNTIYFLVNVAEKTVNVTSVTLGGNTKGNTFQLTANLPAGATIQVAGGEALASNVFLASWVDGSTLKQVTVDCGKSTATSADVAGYQTTYTCYPFVTDKKVFGTVCSNFSSTNNTFSIYTSINPTGLTLLTSSADSQGFTIESVHPYAGYLALFTQHTVVNNGTQTTTKFAEIWDVEKGTAFKNRTEYVTLQSIAQSSLYRVPAGGIYNLLFNQNGTAERTDVAVGMVLSGSHLTSVFGFILATIAGLLLF